MTNGSERFDRIERILEVVAKSQEQLARNLEEFQEQGARSQREMAARQQYHDEAFERHDAEMKLIREAIAADGENIRALVRVAELQNQRLNRLEGGGAA